MQQCGRSLDSVTVDELDQALGPAFDICADVEDNSNKDSSRQTSGTTASGKRPESGHPHARSSSFSPPAKGTKRPRQGDEPPDGKKARQRRKPLSGTGWLCPYYCFDKATYYDCLKYKLLRINDVRTHILRVHVLKPTCPTCHWVSTSKDDSALEQHIQQRACQPRETPPEHLGKTTQDQWDLICQHAKDNDRRSEEDRWFEIWEILFGLHCRRPSCATASQNWRNQLLGDLVEDSHAQGLHYELARHLPPPWCHDPEAPVIVHTILQQYTRMHQEGISSLPQEAASSGPPPPQSFEPGEPLHGRSSSSQLGLGGIGQSELRDFQSHSMTTALDWSQSLGIPFETGPAAPLAPEYTNPMLYTTTTTTNTPLPNPPPGHWTHNSLPPVGGQDNSYSNDSSNWVVLDDWNTGNDTDNTLQSSNYRTR